MTKFFREFLKDETGASAAEYALILAIVGGAIATAAVALSGQISGAIQDTADTIEDHRSS